MIEKAAGRTSPIHPDTLRHRDWEFRGTLENGAQVWFKVGEYVVFPSDRDASDYALRVRLAFEEVAKVEGVSPDSIAEELTGPQTDTMFWRLEPGSVPGEIDLSTLERSLNAMRRMHVYAAASFEARRSMFGKRVSRRARSMSQRLQVGLARKGSYILPVRAPESPNLESKLLTQLVLPGDTYNFEAGSLQLLADALLALQGQLANKIKLTPDSLLQLVENGVSYELVVALIDLLESPRIERVDVTLTSPNMAIQQPRLRFGPDDVSALSDVRERLFGANIAGAEIIVANVKETSRFERGEDAPPGGRVKLRRLGGKGKRSLLTADLNEIDYQIALSANSQRNQVEVRARVVEESGKVPRLEDIEYLRRYVQVEHDLEGT